VCYATRRVVFVPAGSAGVLFFTAEIVLIYDMICLIRLKTGFDVNLFL